MDTKNLQSLVDDIRRHKKKRLEIVRSIDAPTQALVIQQLGRHRQQEILNQLHTEEVAEIVNQLDPVVATDLLQGMPKKKIEAIMIKLDDHMQEDIAHLLPFDPDTAAGLMSLDYIAIDEDEKISHVAQQFKKHETRTGRLPAIVLTKHGKVTGYLPGHQLGFASPEDKAGKHWKKIITIPHTLKSDEVLSLFRLHPHDKAAVLGDSGNILGIIYSDDVLRLLKEQEASSLYDFAGLHAEEEVNDSTRLKVKYRYKWLIINLGTAFLAAFTVGLFEDILSKFVLLAVYMPIVAGMGGNAATQTLAVLVRGIALRQITLHTAWRALKNEVGAALINGIINGLIVAAIVLIVNQDWKIALILAMAMVINLLVAAVFGTIVPLVMKALRKDPAASATIFITTATDVFGFFAFLGLATIILT